MLGVDSVVPKTGWSGIQVCQFMQFVRSQSDNVTNVDETDLKVFNQHAHNKDHEWLKSKLIDFFSCIIVWIHSLCIFRRISVLHLTFDLHTLFFILLSIFQEAVDYRIVPEHKRIACIENSIVPLLHTVANGKPLPTEIRKLIELVFESAACLNSSLLAK